MFNKKGFTLVELMIVIAIIGILAAALFPSLTQYLSRAQDARVRIELKHIVGAFEDYMIANHTWVLSGSYGGGSGSIDYDPTLVGFSLVNPTYAIGEPSPIRELEILGYIKPGYIRQTNDPNLSKYMIDGCGPTTFSVGAKIINQTNYDTDSITYACNGVVNIYGRMNTMSSHSTHPMNTAITRGPCNAVLEDNKNCEGLNLVCINGATNYPTCDSMPF